MDSQTIWIIALSISTPVAGVVGFAIQLREVKKSRLENEKLQLEVAALKKKAADADKRIILATTEEVQRFSTKGHPLASRAPRVGQVVPRLESKVSLKEVAINGSIILSLLLLVGYFLYDIYRLVVWLSTRL
ncbi:MAG: hypothetical protein WA056_15675 [Gallionella sp.]